MKQTVSIFAPDINIASKSSAIQLWLNRKNQFFSSVLEEGVSNRQVLLLGHASFVFSEFMFCPQNCNHVVHALAQFAMGAAEPLHVWENAAPNFITVLVNANMASPV